MARTITCLLAAVLLAPPAARAQDPPRSDGWVVLSIDDYRALRARAFPTPPSPAPPPLDAALTRIDYDLRLAGDTLGGEVRLTIDVLKEGWVTMQVPSGVLVRDARLDGRPTPLVDGKPPKVLVSHAGRSVLTLAVVVPLVVSAGSESISLPAAGSALSSVALAIPRSGVDLTVGGGFLAGETTTGGESRWVAYGSPGQPLTFSWKKKTDDRRATLPLRTRARITELVSLGEESSQVTASVQFEVAQGTARQAVLALPEGFIVNQVQGAMVGDWSQADCSLAVLFLDPIAAETAFVVNGEIRTPREGVVAVPIVRLPAAERESGGIAVDVSGPGEIAERRPQGLEPADPADLDDLVARRATPSMAAFRFRTSSGSAPRELSVTVSRYSPQAVLVANVEEARYEGLVTEDGKTLVRARYAVRNNQRSFLAVTLPPQSTLWSASLGGRPVRPGVAADGAVLLPLEKARAGQQTAAFAVEVVYLQRSAAWTDKGEARVELPAVDLPVSRTGLSLQHSPRFQVEARPGTFRLETDAGPVSAVLRDDGGAGARATPPPPGAESEGAKDFKVLLDKLAKESGRTKGGIVPVDVRLPAFGPSIFLAAELTAEGQAPLLEIAFRRSR